MGIIMKHVNMGTSLLKGDAMGVICVRVCGRSIGYFHMSAPLQSLKMCLTTAAE